MGTARAPTLGIPKEKPYSDIGVCLVHRGTPSCVHKCTRAFLEQIYRCTRMFQAGAMLFTTTHTCTGILGSRPLKFTAQSPVESSKDETPFGNLGEGQHCLLRDAVAVLHKRSLLSRYYVQTASAAGRVRQSRIYSADSADHWRLGGANGCSFVSRGDDEQRPVLGQKHHPLYNNARTPSVSGSL